jgi:hypothetical protein
MFAVGWSSLLFCSQGSRFRGNDELGVLGWVILLFCSVDHSLFAGMTKGDEGCPGLVCFAISGVLLVFFAGLWPLPPVREQGVKLVFFWGVALLLGTGSFCVFSAAISPALAIRATVWRFLGCKAEVQFLLNCCISLIFLIFLVTFLVLCLHLLWKYTIFTGNQNG